MQQITRFILIATIIALLVAIGWAVGNFLNVQRITTQPSATSSEVGVHIPIQVHFSKHPESDDDPAFTAAVARTATTVAVGSFAMSELLKGPTDAETSQGYFRTAHLRDEESNCGKDFQLTIKQGVATLRFCKTFDHVGEISDGQAESEITASLREFPSITKVIILNKTGDCEFNLSGQNLCKQATQ